MEVLMDDERNIDEVLEWLEDQIQDGRLQIARLVDRVEAMLAFLDVIKERQPLTLAELFDKTSELDRGRLRALVDRFTEESGRDSSVQELVAGGGGEDL